MFKQMTGTDMKHIPYKGSAASITAVISGDVQLTIVDSPPLMPQLTSGRVRALAVTTPKRAAAMPDLPAVAESLPGYEMALWIGVFAPAGTARDISSKLNAEIVRVVNLPDIRDRLAGMGVEPLGNSSEQMADWIRGEIAKFGPVVKAGDIRAE
jgi:tripartite-type tricarboxylate transporter receptor subunit TctC